MEYWIVDLGDLGGKSRATAINDAGQIVGFADVGANHHAFIWDRNLNPPMVDLNVGWPAPNSAAFAISAPETGPIGQEIPVRVVGGTSLVSDVPTYGHAFLCWNPFSQPPIMINLDSNNKMISIARGLNDDLIVGQRRLYTPPLITPTENIAVAWYADPVPSDGIVLATFGFPGGKAAAINQGGTIVGRADWDNLGNFRGCRWAYKEAQPVALDPPVQMPQKKQSYAWAINKHGDVVGLYGDDIEGLNNPKQPDRFACFWRKGDTVAQPLYQNLTYSFAWDINDRGERFGASSPQGATYAFYTSLAMLDKGETPLDLNTLLPPNSGWTLNGARGINNHGEIVGVGNITTTIAGQTKTQTHAFLLTPQPGLTKKFPTSIQIPHIAIYEPPPYPEGPGPVRPREHLRGPVEEEEC